MASDVGEAEVEAGAVHLRFRSYERACRDMGSVVALDAAAVWRASDDAARNRHRTEAREILAAAAAVRPASSPQDGGEALRDPGQPEWGRTTFARLFGESYTPVRWGKYEATHPVTLDLALRIAGQRAPELADVIAVLIWQNMIIDNRATHARQAEREAQDRAAAAERERDEVKAVLRRCEWIVDEPAPSPRWEGEGRCPICNTFQTEVAGTHTRDCALAAALDPPPRGDAGPSGTRDGRGEVGRGD